MRTITRTTIFFTTLCFSAAAQAAGIDDPLIGKTSGKQPFDKGEFTREGWRTTSKNCQIRWDLGKLYSAGTVEFDMKGALNQEEKIIIFSAWDSEKGAESETAKTAFFHIRLTDEGMLLRITSDASGGRLEKHTGIVAWPGKDTWVHIKAVWNSAGGVNRLWIDGKEVRKGIFGAKLPGFRYVFLGKDNYGKNYHSAPGITFRNLRVYDLQ